MAASRDEQLQRLRGWLSNTVDNIHSVLFEWYGHFITETLVGLAAYFRKLASVPEFNTIDLTEVIAYWEEAERRFRGVNPRKLEPRRREAIRRWYGRTLIRQVRLILDEAYQKYGEEGVPSKTRLELRGMLDFYDKRLRALAFRNVRGESISVRHCGESATDSLGRDPGPNSRPAATMAW